VLGGSLTLGPVMTDLSGPGFKNADLVGSLVNYFDFANQQVQLLVILSIDASNNVAYAVRVFEQRGRDVW
jgi:hypothetical protein